MKYKRTYIQITSGVKKFQRIQGQEDEYIVHRNQSKSQSIRPLLISMWL